MTFVYDNFVVYTVLSYILYLSLVIINLRTINVEKYQATVVSQANILIV